MDASPAGAPSSDSMCAVTISREYGSGGGEIAARLAKRLSWRLIDHQIVVEVANQLGESLEETKTRDEHAPGFVALLADSLRWVTPASGWMPARTTEEEQQRYRQAVADVIDRAVELGRVVIVGRGAQMLLADWRDVLHVRIVAPFEQRVSYVAVRENLDPHEARARILKKDADRAHYLQTVEHRIPNEAVLYDLTISTSVLSIDQAVELIAKSLEMKACQQDRPDDELGPGAGMTPYLKSPTQ